MSKRMRDPRLCPAIETSPEKSSFLAIKRVYIRLISEMTVSIIRWQYTGLVCKKVKSPI